MSRVLKAHQYYVDESRHVVHVGEEDSANERTYDADGHKVADEVFAEAEQFIESMLDKARRGADIIIEKAQVRAGMVISEAEREAEGLARRTEQEAHNKGFEAGKAEGEAKGARIQQEAEFALEDAKKKRQEIIDSVESEIVELIAKLLNKLLANTLEIHPGIVTVLARSALSGLHTAGDVVINISPEEYEIIAARREEIQAVVDSSCKLEFFKDTSLKAGECIIETAYGTVDVSLDQAYSALIESLTYLYKMGSLVSR